MEDRPLLFINENYVTPLREICDLEHLFRQACTTPCSGYILILYRLCYSDQTM